MKNEDSKPVLPTVTRGAHPGARKQEPFRSSRITAAWSAASLAMSGLSATVDNFLGPKEPVCENASPLHEFYETDDGHSSD